MTKKVRIYSDVFKAEAVKKIEYNNGKISATAKQLGIAMQTLSNWHNRANKGKLVGNEQYNPELINILEEVKRLKRQLKVTDTDHMNLKKSLNLESIYSQGYDIFFSNLNDNINYLEPPFDNPKLFNFYEKYIEETLLFGKNDITREMANLLEVMLWAFFRVWAKQVTETGLITYSLGSEKN